MKRTCIAAMTVLLAVTGSFLGVAAVMSLTLQTEAAFEDVRQDVSDAIINRSYVVDYTAKIGDMLERTASDVGSTQKIYSGAETAQFCSAVLSRKMMEADPTNIAFCPYVVFYYQNADEPGVVHVGYRKLPEDGSAESKAARQTINRLLADIVEEAAGN